MKRLLLFLLVYLLPSFLLAEDKLDRQLIPVDSFRRPNKSSYRLDAVVPQESKSELVELGRLLFFDPRLSRSSLISCATCHNPSFYWTDSLKVSIEKGTRKSMSLLNLGADPLFSWQGRARSITSMIKLPLSAPSGMNTDQHILDAHIASIPAYKRLFNSAFASISKRDDVSVEISTVGYALEMFISEQLVSPKSRFDSFIEGDLAIFSDAEKRGFDVFRGKGGCAKCHAGWKLSDGEIYDIGIRIDPNDGDLFQGDTTFKAVGLRAIASRPPYMHNGSLSTLSEVIEFYNRGGDDIRSSHSQKVRPLNLSELEKEDLRVFLMALDEEPIPMYFPRLPR